MKIKYRLQFHLPILGVLLISEAATGGTLYKKVLENFTKFTGKHLCQNLFFNKVAGLRPERLWHRCFRVNFVKFSRIPIL